MAELDDEEERNRLMGFSNAKEALGIDQKDYSPNSGLSFADRMTKAGVPQSTNIEDRREETPITVRPGSNNLFRGAKDTSDVLQSMTFTQSMKNTAKADVNYAAEALGLRKKGKYVDDLMKEMSDITQGKRAGY